MKKLSRISLKLLPVALLVVAQSGCADKSPPVSVSELMENPRLLEATMVRCSADRGLRYEVACVNARDASSRLEAAAERARREELERQSASKRQALREAQAAADVARQRALEDQKLREEEEYHGQFGTTPDGEFPESETEPADGAPNAPENP